MGISDLVAPELSSLEESFCWWRVVAVDLSSWDSGGEKHLKFGGAGGGRRSRTEARRRSSPTTVSEVGE